MLVGGKGTRLRPLTLSAPKPLLPTAGVLIWEAITPILPAALQRLSVIFYLKSLCPVMIPGDTPTVMAPLFVKPVRFEIVAAPPA